MKITSQVMLRKPDLPDREAWQAALHSHGFDLALPEDFDPLVFSGVVRCRIEGAAASFEYAFQPLERRGYNEVELRDLGARDHVAVFSVAAPGVASMGAASIAAALLCAISDGLLADIGAFTPAAAAIARAHRDHRMMGTMMKIAGYAQQSGPPLDDTAEMHAWMEEMQATTGIALPLIPPRVPGQAHPAPPSAEHVRMAVAPDNLESLWYEIEDLNRARVVELKWEDRFARPSDEKELRYFESRLGHFIPEDLRNLFMVCSGFQDPWPVDEREPIIVDLLFLLGGIQFPLVEPAAGKPAAQPLHGRNLLTLESVGDFLDMKTDGPCLCYDRSHATAGRIVEVDFTHRTYRVVAANLRAWLEDGREKLRTFQQT